MSRVGRSDRVETVNGSPTRLARSTVTGMRNEALDLAGRRGRRTARGVARAAAVVAAVGWAVVMVWPHPPVLVVAGLATLATIAGYGWAWWDAATAAGRARRDRHAAQAGLIDHDSVR